MDSPLHTGMTFHPPVGGVEDLIETHRPLKKSTDQDTHLFMDSSLRFNLDLEVSCNEVLQKYSDDNFLTEALQELESPLSNPISKCAELSPAPTELSTIPSINDDDLSDFVDIEGLYDANDSVFKTENPNKMQPEPSLNIDIKISGNTMDVEPELPIDAGTNSAVGEQLIKTEPVKTGFDEEEFLNSLFCGDNFADLQNEYPNITPNFIPESDELVTLEPVNCIQNLPSTSAEIQLPVTNCLEELMIKSGLCPATVLVQPEEDPPKQAQSEEIISERKRKISEDFHVISEKSPKVYSSDLDSVGYSPCPSSSGDDMKAERRRRNNAASKISRANRKSKQNQMFEKEKQLSEENEKLRNKIEEMTREAEGLRKILILKLSGKE